MDIEIYRMKAKKEQILFWINSKFKVVALKMTEENEMEIYEGEYKNTLIPIMVQPLSDKFQCTGIWFSSGETPWQSDIECGREAHQFTGLPVLCNPDDQYPLPNQFLLINLNGERIIDIDE